MDDTQQNVINYLIQSDFAENLSACTGETELTEFHLRQTVKQAAEVFNAESRGAFLRYGGTFTGNPDTVCSSYPSPTVFVTFVPGCQLDTNDVCTSAIGHVGKISGCTNGAKLEIYGSTSTSGACTPNPEAWRFDFATTDQYNLRGVLVHEFGHALGLGHPNTVPVPNTGTSTMRGAYNSGVNYYSHLYPWEKDCVDEKWDGRLARPYYRGYDSFGSFKSSGYIGSQSERTQKGNLMGYPWRDGFSYYAYSLMNANGDYRRASVGSDGYFTWSNTGSDWSPNPMDVNFTFLNVFPGTATYAHVYYNWVNSRTLDPPEVKAIQSTNNFQSGNTVTVVYERIGSSDVVLRSHVPVSSTRDPISTRTIFASVNTTRGDANEGGIKIHPGLRTSFNRLHQGQYVHANVTLPTTTYSNWDYQGQTYFAPGVACVVSVPSNMNGFNCVVAWVDRGTPDTTILYTWFRINGGSNTVVWHGTTYRRASTSAVSHVSLGAFNNQIYMSYRATAVSPQVGLTINDLSGFTSWSNVSYLSASAPIVDAPTWGTRDDVSEATLMWSQSN